LRNRTLAALVAVVIAAAVVGSGLVVASASTLGTLASSMFAAGGAVTFPAATQTVSTLTLVKAGNPATVSRVTVVVTGSTLSSLNGQTYTVDLIDSTGALIQSLTGTLATGSNLTVGASTATISLAVSGSPLASRFATWSAFIAGTEPLGGAASTTQRYITLGGGAVQ
jgi:hypothetical protein